MTDRKKVIVVGAGISGLTAAYKLKQFDFDVTLFEKNDHIGGNIKTEWLGQKDNFKGFLFEHGPNSGLETTPLIHELCESLDISGRKIYANSKANKRYILRNGILHELAMSPKFLTSKLFSVTSKLRLAREPFIRSKSHPKETLAEFTKRRLGEEFLDYAINPFVAGVFAGDPFNLNVMTAFPRLYELEQNYGSLIGGAIKSGRERKKRAEKSKQTAKTFSFINGMQELSDTLKDKLKSSIHSGHEVINITGSCNNYKVTYSTGDITKEMAADAVVLSVPAYKAAGFIRTYDSKLFQLLLNINYPPVNVVFMAYKKDNIEFDIDGFGYLVPAKENRKILGSLWNSVIFDDRAPEGYVTLTNFIGGARSPELTELDDDRTLKIVYDDLKQVLGLKTKPELTKIVRWKRAIPQYHKDYDEVFNAIENFHYDNKGFVLCSNYYKGISIGDCIKSAHAAADLVRESLDYNLKQSL